MKPVTTLVTLTFGQWLERQQFHRETHLYEHDYRGEALAFNSDEEREDFMDADFSSVESLIDSINEYCRRQGGGPPLEGAIEGAVRCWVRWRDYQDQHHENFYKQ